MKWIIISPGIVTIYVSSREFYCNFQFQQRITAVNTLKIMRTQIFIGVLFSFSVIQSNECLGISDKLDFGGDSSSPSIIRNHNQYKSLNIPSSSVSVHTVETKPKENSFENIGVVCVSGGCNTTKVAEGDSDSIKTDVVVHVQTTVNTNNKSSTHTDDTPDVPVVIGYDGAKLDTSIDTDGHSFNPAHTIVIDDDNLPASFNPYVPSATGIGLQPPILNSRVDTGLNSLYLPPAIDQQANFDFNINPLPTMTLTVDNTNNLIKEVSYKSNGVEVHVPYFEPSFNMHYYGEHPPQPLVWYPKKSGSFNPVEFRNVPKSSWSPSLWNARNTPVHHSHKHTNTCSCNKPDNSPGLNWYPNANRRQFNSDPGSQINDKLAPLN